MQKENVFDQSAWKAIFTLSIPSLISIAVMMLYNMADMYFVAWMNDYTKVAAVSLAMPVYTILMAISTMISNGGCTKIAQALGKQDKEQLRRISALCAWASIAFGLVFALACFLFCRPLLQFLGANEEMWNDTRAYILILAAGTPIILVNYSLGGALRGQGAVKAGLMGGLISTLANIVLDPIFILWLGLGVGGAAAATVLGNVIAIVYYAVYHRKIRGGFILEFSPRYARDITPIIGILAIGLPNAISSVLSGLAGTFSNQILVGYGTGAVAAMAAASKAVMVVTMIQMGICMGIQPLLAYCFGGRNWGKLKEVAVKTLLLTICLGVALTALILLVRGRIVGLFLQDAEVAALGRHMVTLLLLAGPFIGVYYFSTNFLQAAGSALKASLVSALRQGLLLIPLLYLLSGLFGLEGLALAHPAADGISVLLAGGMALIHFLRQRRRD